MNNNQLLRYSRHILLKDIDIKGQEKFLAAHALIVGIGGLGSPAALYLAAAGFGKLTLVDHDVVNLTNLQRQIMYTTAQLGELKVYSGKSILEKINPDIQVIASSKRIDDNHLNAFVPEADVVLDCSDNFITRYAVNRACVQYKVPLVSGAAVCFNGHIGVFNTSSIEHSLPSCYACLFPQKSEFSELPCSMFGVFAPLVGIIGALQAAEALKLVAKIGRSLACRLQILNAYDMTWTNINLVRNPLCAVCSHLY